MNGYAGRGVHGHVVEELGISIVHGDHSPEAPIDLVALEQRFDVSRTVIREALKVLAAKGLVDSRQRRGTVVRERSAWSLLDADVMRWDIQNGSRDQMLADLAEVRRTLEPTYARLAATRRTDHDLREIRAALNAMAAAETATEAASADVWFHLALATASHNEMLTRIAALNSAALSMRDLSLPTHVDDPVPSHRRVLDAVAEQDPAAAEAAMRDLLDRADRDTEPIQHQEANA